MLSAFMNQTAEYRACTGSDGRGQPTYGAPVSIACRRQKQTKNVLTPTGQAIQIQHVYFTAHEVNEGDMLDGLVVMAVTVWTGLFGEVRGYKAMM